MSLPVIIYIYVLMEKVVNVDNAEEKQFLLINGAEYD